MKPIAIILTLAIPLLAQLPEFGSSPGGGSGSGTVEAITATCGLNTADGAAITISGSIKGSRIVNAQTGTSYAIQNSDCGKLLTISNGAAIALSIAQAGTGGFDAGWYLTVRNLGAGTATITPATSTINGAATLAIVGGRSAEIYSDGTNYQVAGASAFAEADVARLSVSNAFSAAQVVAVTINNTTGLTTRNLNAGAIATAQVAAENGAGSGRIAVRALGTGFTTSGALSQDGGALTTDANLSGGLSIAAEAGNMRFYNGGTADANLVALWSGSSLCLGPENAACSGTLEVQSGVPTTGNTVITFALGAGDALTSNIFTVAGKMTASGGIVLPAACTGLSAGVLYNNAGTPAICP